MQPQPLLRTLLLSAIVATSLAARGDVCRSSAGSGTCKQENSCATGFTVVGECPDDPKDVKCCIQVKCRTKPGTCLDKSRQDCKGGKFVAGDCPGPDNVQCCIVDEQTKPTPKPEPNEPVCDLKCETDRLLFSVSINEFLVALEKKQPAGLDWSKSDGCTWVPDRPGTYDFIEPCARHDFGYGNYPKQGRKTEDNRAKIDRQFKDDMYNECNKYTGLKSFKGVHCRRVADIYYNGVRAVGENFFG